MKPEPRSAQNPAQSPAPRASWQTWILPIISGLLLAALVLLWAPHWIIPGAKPIQLSASSTADTAATAHQPLPPSRAPINVGAVSYASAVDRAAPSVVNIFTRKIVKRRVHPLLDDPQLQQFIRDKTAPSQRKQSSLGSGVIMSANGYVLTNRHVILGADEIVVAMRDGREAEAVLIGSDQEADLAVLKIDLDNLPFMQIAPFHNHSIGDVVLAIGNPFGVGQTVTMGIISALGRNQLGLNTYENYIQTDAAINPGNSGGALINAYGELVGINTAIYSQSGGSEGIGFTIPAQTAIRVLNDIATHGSTIRGWLGIGVREAKPKLLVSLGLPQALKGLIVTAIYPGGPAEQAGLAIGDILTRINDMDAADSQRAMNQIAALRPGDSIDIELLRAGQTLRTRAIAGKRQSQ